MKVRNIARRRPGELLTRSMSAYNRKMDNWRHRELFRDSWTSCRVPWKRPLSAKQKRLLRWDQRRK